MSVAHVPSSVAVLNAFAIERAASYPSRRADFVAALGELAARRPLWWISQESYEAGLNLVLPDRADLSFDPTSGATPSGTLGLVRWVQGRPEAVALARTAFHGERIVWLAT